VHVGLFAVCNNVHKHHASTASIPKIDVVITEDDLANDLSWDEAGNAQHANSVNRLIGRKLLDEVQEEWTAMISFHLGAYNAFQLM
jgi:hypothetical protein